MTEILHITERAVWDAGRTAGEYRMSSRGITLEQEGFIHCSLPGQLRGVAERYYADADDLVVLVVDTDLVPSPVRFERPAPGAEEYPHIYGPIPPGAVTAVIDVSRDETGRLVLPGSG
jgi:uncharacterized protein (DUF952 family)